MFKYYISVPFRCFTQYYEIIRWYYELLYHIHKLSNFWCALYKKGGVENPARMQEFNRGILIPRTGLQCVLWCDWIVPVMIKFY